LATTLKFALPGNRLYVLLPASIELNLWTGKKVTVTATKKERYFCGMGFDGHRAELIDRSGKFRVLAGESPRAVILLFLLSLRSGPAAAR